MYFVGTIIICKLKFNGYVGETLYYMYGYNSPHASVPLALSECPAILKWKDGYPAVVKPLFMRMLVSI